MPRSPLPSSSSGQRWAPMGKLPEFVTDDMSFTAGGSLLPAVSQLSEAILSRFWAKVDKSGDGDCWLWTAGTDELGYGKFTISRLSIAAHRLSFALANGRWPSSSMVVLHSCDNPSCVNPDHLKEGDLSQNLTEAYARGRRSGTVLWRDSSLTPIRRGGSSLSEWDVREIRRRKNAGESVATLSSDYQVKPPTIRDVVNGRTFTWVIGEGI